MGLDLAEGDPVEATQARDLVVGCGLFEGIEAGEVVTADTLTVTYYDTPAGAVEAEVHDVAGEVEVVRAALGHRAEGATAVDAVRRVRAGEVGLPARLDVVAHREAVEGALCGVAHHRNRVGQVAVLGAGAAHHRRR